MQILVCRRCKMRHIPFQRLRPCLHVSGKCLSDCIRRKFHRIGIAFKSIWKEFLSCSHIARYDCYTDKFYADRHSHLPGQAVHTCLGSENCSPDRFVFHFQRRINILSRVLFLVSVVMSVNFPFL